MLHVRRFRWIIACLLFFASALSFFDRQVLSILAPRILADLRMSSVEYSNAVAAFTLAYSVMFTAGGRLIDHIGTRFGLGLLVVFWTVSSLLHSITANSGQLTAFRFLLGVGEGGCFPGAAKGVLEWFPARERALAMGVATTGGSAIGGVLAPPVIVWIASALGWRGAFLATGIVGALWAIAWFALYYKPERSRHISDAERIEILSDQPASSPSSQRPWPLSRLLTRGDVWGFTVTRFLLDPVFYFYMFWIPQYLHRERGASLEEIGRLAWIPFFTLGVSSLLGGAISDMLVRRGWPITRARKSIMAASAFLTPVSILALYTPNSLWAVALLGVLMFAHGFWMTNFMTLIGDRFPASSVGTVVGLTGTAGGLGGFLTSLMVGRLVEAYSFAPAFVVCGLLYPVGLLIILLTVPDANSVQEYVEA